MVVSNNNINLNEDDFENNITINKKKSFTPNTMTTINLGGQEDNENGTAVIKPSENHTALNSQIPIQFSSKTPRNKQQQQNYPNDDNSLEIEKLKSLINQEEQLK